ncbi:uncharacterized protein LOC126903574 [Daktulosphaira vitifoliae]|uniref:uncharacterized protein LOC126903574 n=1 Tax=Daktulosphaira vitifoliae TaxID=58002 RepID=UPI0021A992AF|nr:uncharacterized protein LOC126903574 [Daktulosphaira vitifoliae]
MLTIFLIFYILAPFTCAFINRYGFRYCLFFGSLMTICWAIFMWLFDSTFTTKTGWILAALGGAGTGVIQTTFTVLLSLLYNMSRPAAHLLMHLGSFAGIIVVPPLTEYIILFVGWRTASFFHFIMLLMSLLFWILVAIPVPQKIEIIDDGPVALNENSIQSKAMHVAKDVNNLRRNDRLPTVWNTIGNRELRVFPFKKDTPLFKRTKTLKSLGIDRKQRLYIIKEPEVYLSTLRDFFNVPLIGSRPLYRDDVLFTGHVYHVLENEMKDQEFFYPLLMTRIMTLDDLEQELNKRYKCWTTAMSRPFITLFMPTIWYTSIKFILLAAAEFFIHSARFAPFLFLKGPPGSKTSAETMVTLIAGGIGLLAGRAIGYIMHETSSLPVPIYTVSITLMANGLCLFLSATTELKEILPYFLLFGLFFGYYNSVQNALLYNVFPVHKINNVYGQISLVKAVASFVGIIVAVVIVQRDNRQSTERVYIYAGLLMMAAGTCVGILQAACNCLRNNCSSPLICDSIKRRRLSCSTNKKMAVCPPMVAL